MDEHLASAEYMREILGARHLRYSYVSHVEGIVALIEAQSRLGGNSVKTLISADYKTDDRWIAIVSKLLDLGYCLVIDRTKYIRISPLQFYTLKIYWDNHHGPCVFEQVRDAQFLNITKRYR